MTTSYQKISGFDRPHVSEMLSDSKISALECGFKNFRIRLRIRRMRVDDSRIRKEKVADSKLSGYVWMGPKSISLCQAGCKSARFGVPLKKITTMEVRDKRNGCEL